MVNVLKELKFIFDSFMFKFKLKSQFYDIEIVDHK